MFIKSIFQNVKSNIKLMKSQYSILLFLLFFVINASACDSKDAHHDIQNNVVNKGNDNMKTIKIKIKVNSKDFTATLLSNKTTEDFIKLLPLTIKMEDHLRNEKHVDLATKLRINPSNPGTIQNGDIMLFGSKTLVLFYDSFQTSYSYTKLGKVDDPTGLAKVLGLGSITVHFELK